MRYFSVLLIILLVEQVKAQEIQFLKTFTQNDSVVLPSYFIVKGEKSCMDCYFDLLNALRQTNITQPNIYFLAVLNGTSLDLQNELKFIKDNFKISEKFIYFTKNEDFMVKGRTDDQFYPKFVIFDLNKNVHIFNYNELFGKMRFKKRKFKRFIRNYK